ncbi:N-acylethanolamine amidohydrolase [Aspergillus heteromorphus CBS 117.55]|uniref:N-acylethanolamine amidohydrolase n=1 Tax=Aspergillus heteromorphus CBS 117.55 TaxID=1448321 RepID=A0A317X066_9EURO|nr:N-acylethanolamine amidohydrolase [Aspergillus heteromorphus CBS 117.55]PWY92034.1 N-acylethanolamine amidohydrolase [Aspergillus heteromorphus CBS 117.55]
MGEKARFFYYPEVRQGPTVPYKNEDQVIPVFRGTPLAIGASLIQNIGLVQNYFWRNAGFSIIRDLPLDQYSPRYDPTVIPVLDTDNNTTSTTSPATLPVPTEKRTGNVGYYTTADYVALYKSGELTPIVLVETLLPLIRRDASPPGKHSVAFLDSQVERIRAAAEASTQRYKDGCPLGPLDGIPVAIKDEVHMEGYRRTLGSKMDFTGDVRGTSWCVRKWEEAGAIVIGKTTMHELGLDTNNNNPNYGTPRNPHNANYYCGGSSGDPATPGSPTVSLASTVGVYGPMASNLDDLALAYRIMATPAPATADPLSSTFPSPLSELAAHLSLKRSPRPIGIIPPWLTHTHPTVLRIFNRALAHFTSLNHPILELDIPYLPEGQRAHVLTIMNEIASGLTPSQISSLTAPNKVLVSMGMWQITGQDFLASQRLRNLLMAHLAFLFREHPGLVILTPTTPIPGWEIEGGEKDLVNGLSDGKTSVRNMEFVWLANFTGCPAVSCPVGYCGKDGDGDAVPVGLMAMGEWGTEEDLIDFAREGEGILGMEEEEGASGSGLSVPAGWEDVVRQAVENMRS